MGGIPNPENTDQRAPGDWKSKYGSEALREIEFEAYYLLAIYIIAVILAVIIWGEFPVSWFNLNGAKYLVFKKFAIIALGGVFGGTLFDIKWLIHAVAKTKWHMDRRLWRLFVPLTSAAFSVAFAAIIISGFIKIFDSNSLQSPSTGFGFGFLVGYFSDNAIAKLSEVAQTLFGTLEDQKKPKTEMVGSNPSNLSVPTTLSNSSSSTSKSEEN